MYLACNLSFASWWFSAIWDSFFRTPSSRSRYLSFRVDCLSFSTLFCSITRESIILEIIEFLRDLQKFNANFSRADFLVLAFYCLRSSSLYCSDESWAFMPCFTSEATCFEHFVGESTDISWSSFFLAFVIAWTSTNFGPW